MALFDHMEAAVMKTIPDK